ncbi:uncharacterized protein LOC126846251 [Adelges cooleyi]|uniref:uncharacterized protein LOC126846251 n=1 Tax=Adelges cooleyi TaxID=133065 RepID=UPI0021805DB1|nr:uncharacterized protein LOC126846251 [Adelges cooleyi]XP_050441485.1 uncharacterized protein LOC126846251 [Adelges cooleyi]
MDTTEVMNSANKLFNAGRFTECCIHLQQAVDYWYLNVNLKNIKLEDEITFLILKNNLLLCNCLRILPTISEDYVSKMTELINFSKLHLFEQHIPIYLRINFMYNTLYWYWLKPAEIIDYCYSEVITLVNDCLLQVLQELDKNIINLSSHVGEEENILKSLEHLSNMFLCLEPILVIQCLEVSQILMQVFLCRQTYVTLFMDFISEILDKVNTIITTLKHKKSNIVFNCFKFGLSPINSFLSIDHINTVIITAHVSLCIGYTLERQHKQALSVLSTVDQYTDIKDQIFCLQCYLQAFANFNLEKYEDSFYYLAQMTNCSMDEFIRSRYYILLGRNYSKSEKSDMAISTFEKLKDSKYNRAMAFYMSQHYEYNSVKLTQILVLDQIIQGELDAEDNSNTHAISYSTRVLLTIHPQPDLTRRQLLYLAAKKKYNLSKYKLAILDFENLIKLDAANDAYQSELVPMPSNFMLRCEAAVAFLKAHEMSKAFTLCHSLIEEYDCGFGMWKSDSFWANELNSYDFNVVGALLLAETGIFQESDTILNALNKSFNCLYTKIDSGYSSISNEDEENVKTFRRVLMGKVLLLKATVLSRLVDREDECEATYNKALKYNPGDEDIIYLFSKWLEHKGRTTQSISVRDCFDKNISNTIVCDNLVLDHVLKCSAGHENTNLGICDRIDDLFADTDEKITDINTEMNPVDDDIFNDLFVD